MTKAEATLKALAWWEEMILSGAWNNGDGETESQHSLFRTLSGPKPTEGELALCRPFFLKLLQAKAEHPNATDGRLYSDYGNAEIDAVFQAAGVRLRATIHTPQKAGTWFQHNAETGAYFVIAKTGYGEEWKEL
jgi:hypothetical protein